MNSLSITSKEYRPSEQTFYTLLSEYFSETWAIYSADTRVKMFHTLLMSFPAYRFSIIDFYGTLANEKIMSFTFLCEIMGILCESRLHEQLKDLAINAAVPQERITEKQVLFVVNKFMLSRNCSMNSTQAHSAAREFIINTPLNRKWNMSIPLREVDLSLYVRNSVGIDKYLRT